MHIIENYYISKGDVVYNDLITYIVLENNYISKRGVVYIDLITYMIFKSNASIIFDSCI